MPGERLWELGGAWRWGWGGAKEDVRFCDLALERKRRHSELRADFRGQFGVHAAGWELDGIFMPLPTYDRLSWPHRV